MAFFGDEVYLREEDHRYFHRVSNVEYMSTSAVLNMATKAFDREGRSLSSAEKIIREDKSGAVLNVNVVQAQLKKEWDDKAKKSNDHGTDIHKSLEVYGKTTKVKFEHAEMVKAVYYNYRNHAIIHLAEECTYSHEFLVAGTVDKPLCRTTGPKSAVDYRDWKTNIAKGIQYYSPYGNFLLDPVSHLEDCNFNRYALQLSIYAYMGEERGKKCGNLAIDFINPFDLRDIKTIPVPYMRMEAKALLQHAFRSRKAQMPKQVYHLDDDF
jgi:hypothetical protein